MPIIQWQKHEWPCPGALCEPAGIMVPYEFSSSGPWTLKNLTIECHECGTKYRATLKVGVDNMAHVSIRPDV